MEAPIKIRDAADARAFVAKASHRSHIGLTAREIRATRQIYRFDARSHTFAAGLAVYLTPLPNEGFCVSFAAATGCSRTPPDGQEPLIGLGFDPDAERAGEPFVLISLKAPQVAAVTYTCGDRSYAASISGAVVTFVAPSSSLRADDCTEHATLTTGRIVSKRV